MCGFCGFTGNTADKTVTLTHMMNTIIHRGPDSEGTHIDDQIALGFRRLSIIGLEDGAQPMYNETNDLVLVFNGEIYNYQTIKEELLRRGHIFKTHADSEVLLHSYEEYGTHMLTHLRGMFAFAIWDEKKQTLFLARDFFGIKPLYYTYIHGDLLFGSEIKSILAHPSYQKELNVDALQSYLTFQYSPLPETFFKGIFKLPPAHFLLFTHNKIELTRYWEPVFSKDEKPLDQTVDEIDVGMKESIKMHKVSDVEVGCFLSSGVDSSYVAACFQGDKTFTVGFDYEKYNEIEYAKALSKEIGIDNYHKLITTEEYWSILPTVQYHMDEPLADPSAVALYFVSELASHHVKVVLSGEGADELFGGYNIYKEPLDLYPITRLPMIVRRCLGKLASLLPIEMKGKNYLIRGSKTLEERFIGNAFMFTEKERSKLLKHQIKGYRPMELTKPYYDKASSWDDITKMQYLDIHMWMPGDILLKADKMSMAHSLELRVPFLDKELCRIATKIPVQYRVNKENTKYAMRLAAKRNLPEHIANKKKLGFPVPIRIWLREEKYYTIVKKAFTSSSAKAYFHTSALLRLLDDHYQNKKDHSRKIWVIYMFLLWHKQFFA